MEEPPNEIAVVSSSTIPSAPTTKASSNGFNMKNFLSGIPGIRAQLYATFAVCVSAFVAGTASAWAGPMILVLSSHESPVGLMNSDETSMLVTCMQLSSIMSLAVSGLLVDGKGRQWGGMLCGFLPSIGWVILTFARNVQAIFVGASLIGSTVMSTLTIGVAYLCEMANDKIRGAAVSMMMFSFSFGEMMTHIMGEYMTYRNYHLAGLFVSVTPFIFLLRLPESPQYLVLKGRIEEARKSIAWFNGNDPLVIEEEMKKLELNRKQRACNPEKFTGGNLRALVITLFLFIWCELVGTTLIETYSGVFLAYASNPIFAGHATVILAVCRFIAGVVSCYLVEKKGRRKLIVWTLIIQSFTLMATAIFIGVKNFGFDSKLMLSTFVCLIIYTIANEMFVATAETISGEVVNPEVKGWVLSLAGCFRVIAIIVTLQIYPPLWKMAHFSIFIFFCIGCLIGLLISIIIIPETKGKSLTDIRESMNFNFRPKSYKWKVQHV